MRILNGKYATAHIMTDNIEPEAVNQIQELTNSIVSEGQKIAIMPDVHAGKGSTIGTVMTVGERVVPAHIGLDIGCGVYAYRIGPKGMNIDFEILQRVIEVLIPSGNNVREEAGSKLIGIADELIPQFRAPIAANRDYFARSLGTLGGGNHFISVEEGSTGTYLLIHSGSRNLGVQVAKHYQNLAMRKQGKKTLGAIIDKMKAEGRHREIEAFIKNMPDPEPRTMAYLTGQDLEDYLHDMKLAQRYAHENREIMAHILIVMMRWSTSDIFNIYSVHNYIDTETRILRKGAVAAYKGKPFLVPLNMKDGTLICLPAEDRPDWLFSAPHGAGRAMSRRRAKDTLNMEEFQNSMQGIWTASVAEEILDEAPGAYKPADEIKEILNDVYPVIDHLVPIFNFKAKE